MTTRIIILFFFNDTATTEIYTLSLHDALPIYHDEAARPGHARIEQAAPQHRRMLRHDRDHYGGVFRPLCLVGRGRRSEEHKSERQAHQYLVCRLMLEKKKRHTRVCLCHYLPYV